MAESVFRVEDHPEWGLGLVVENREGNWVLFFEHGGRKVFRPDAKGLIPVSLDSGALEALRAKVHGKRASPKNGKPKAKRSAAKKKSTAVFGTFDEQVKHFEKLFPGGFEGEAFTSEERGREGVEGKAGYKTRAIAMAREGLSPARFEAAPPAELFETAKRVLGATNIVFPIEGHIPFGAIAEAERPAVVAALGDLLHGAGDYAERLERFPASMNLKNKKGEVKPVTWPLATVFAALYSPDEQVCVKPTYFALQAATFGRDVAASQPITAAGYRTFFEVAKETQKLLLAAGHRPRDLMDVYSFIWRTHYEKPH